MRASSSVDPAALGAVASTLALAAAFALPWGAERRSVTTYASFSGGAFAVDLATAAPADLAAPIAAPAKPAARPTKVPKRVIAAAAKPAAAPPAPAAPPQPAPTQAPAAASSDAIPDYKLQELEERFEADAAKYPLGRTVRTGGVTLTLVALERLDKLCVLKISVVNESAKDFFVRRFAVLAGSLELQSRTLFRVLVEPRREREGYLVFKRPEPGSAVHVVLKEDSGKARAFDAPVSYPF